LPDKSGNYKNLVVKGFPKYLKIEAIVGWVKRSETHHLLFFPPGWWVLIEVIWRYLDYYSTF